MKAQQHITEYLDGRTQRWLARKLDVRDNTVSEWIKGTFVPKLEHRIALTALIGVDVCDPVLWK